MQKGVYTTEKSSTNLTITYLLNNNFFVEFSTWVG